MKLVENQLKECDEADAFIIQGSDDPVVNSVSALEIFEKLGYKGKTASPDLCDHHGILRGREAG